MYIKYLVNSKKNDYTTINHYNIRYTYLNVITYNYYIRYRYYFFLYSRYIYS